MAHFQLSAPSFNCHGPLPTSSFFLGGIFPILTLPFSGLPSPHAPLSTGMANLQLECPSSKFFLPRPGSERSRACLFLPIFPSLVLLHFLGPFLGKAQTAHGRLGLRPNRRRRFYPLSTLDSHFLLSWPTVDFYRPLPSFLFLGRDPRDPDPAFFAQFFPSAPFSWMPLFYPASTPGSHFQLPSPSSNLIAPMTSFSGKAPFLRGKPDRRRRKGRD